MEDKLRNHTLVGFSYSICSQGDRLTGAFNYYYPLPEGPILKKILNFNGSERKCQSVCMMLVAICIDLERWHAVPVAIRGFRTRVPGSLYPDGGAIKIPIPR